MDKDFIEFGVFEGPKGGDVQVYEVLTFKGAKELAKTDLTKQKRCYWAFADKAHFLEDYFDKGFRVFIFRGDVPTGCLATIAHIDDIKKSYRDSIDIMDAIKVRGPIYKVDCIPADAYGEFVYDLEDWCRDTLTQALDLDVEEDYDI